jgi:hypothetical protein
MAVSHSHPDHAGNIEVFPHTLMLAQRLEYEWARSRQDTVAFNKKHPVKLIDGDYDIFGDGGPVLLSTPGHTPGHQALLMRLPKTGPVILSSDVAHFQTTSNTAMSLPIIGVSRPRSSPRTRWRQSSRRNMRSTGLTKISPKTTRKRSCRRVTSDGYLATCRKGLIGSDTTQAKSRARPAPEVPDSVRKGRSSCICSWRPKDCRTQPVFAAPPYAFSRESFDPRREFVNYCCPCLAHDFVLGIRASRTADCADNHALVDQWNTASRRNDSVEREQIVEMH